MARADSRGFIGYWGGAPAAMVTIMVSPTAREMPSTKEATMPERAAGTTTWVAVSRLVAPKAYAPSRNERGTAWMASSLTEATVGMIITPITSPAARML